MYPKMNFIVVVGLLVILCSFNSFAQVERMEGVWELSTEVPEAEYGPVTIDASGNSQFTETYPYEIGGQEYLIDVEHVGVVTFRNQEEYDYVGTANGFARDTEESIKVFLDVTGNGLLSSDGNMAVGVWMNTEEYTTPTGTYPDYDGSPYVLVRQGYDPGTPEEEQLLYRVDLKKLQKFQILSEVPTPQL